VPAKGFVETLLHDVATVAGQHRGMAQRVILVINELTRVKVCAGDELVYSGSVNVGTVGAPGAARHKVRPVPHHPSSGRPFLDQVLSIVVKVGGRITIGRRDQTAVTR